MRSNKASTLYRNLNFDTNKSEQDSTVQMAGTAIYKTDNVKLIKQ